MSAVPVPVRRAVGHELRVLASLLRWPARRVHGVRGPHDRAFGHARDQAAIMYALTFVCVVEAYGMSVLLRNWPALHLATLVLDVYGAVLLLGIHAASVTRPHVLSPDGSGCARAPTVTCGYRWRWSPAYALSGGSRTSPPTECSTCRWPRRPRSPWS
ncbi:hypothetical protein ACFYO9_14175 [Streptomyces sp. NPDC005863]|uniref:hypothetical protein n=1 Tax=unclassified Streptomyces TaxID=2593676 RepID=UPI0033D36517